MPELRDILKSGQIDSAEFQTTQSPVLVWRGQYDGEDSLKGDVKRQGAWIMVANKDTSDAPAPIDVGAPQFGLPEDPLFETATATTVLDIRETYTFTEFGRITSIRLWIPEFPETQELRIFVVNVTDPANPISENVALPILTANGWNTIGVSSRFVNIGTVMTVIAQTFNTSATIDITGEWVYISENPNDIPLTGEWTRENSVIRISKTDNLGQFRGVEILEAISGTRIQFVDSTDFTESVEYITTGNAIDGGDYVEYPISRTGQGTGGNPEDGTVCIMAMNIPIPEPVTYPFLTDYYATPLPFADVTSEVLYDGVVQPDNNDAHGIDIGFQESYVSPDWDSLTFPANGSTGALTIESYDYSKTVEVVLTTDVWTEVGRLTTPNRPSGTYETKLSMTYSYSATTRSVYLRFSTNGGVSWNEFRQEPKDNTDELSKFYAYPSEFDGGIREIIVQARCENATDVFTIHYLDIIFEYKKPIPEA